jgi:hypothetical protein
MQMTRKEEAVALLRKYDAMRREFRLLERELTKACTDYGVSVGIRCFTRDHLRMQTSREEAA